MATVPSYAATPNNDGVALANSDSTNAVIFFTAGASGSRVNRVTVNSGPTTAPGGTTKVCILRDAIVIDIFSMVNTVDTFQFERTYSDLLLEAGQTLKIQSRTALTSGATLHANAFGADL